MKNSISRFLWLALFVSAPVHADANLDLATKKQCMSCHTLDLDSRETPSFKTIASQFHDKPHAESILVEAIMKGDPVKGGYHWGEMPMPGPIERPRVSRAEADQLARWILNMR